MPTSKEIANKLVELGDRIWYDRELDLEHRQKLIKELEDFEKKEWNEKK